MSDSEIFKAAVKLSPDRRQAFLDQTCGAQHPELRREVESLLLAHDTCGSFLEKPAAGFVATHAFANSSGDTVKEMACAVDFLLPSENPDCLGTIGQYEVSEVVGRGGMGVVLKGFDPKLNRVVAIKVLAPELATHASARRRFLREGQAAAAISHDHVVTVHGIDDSGPLPFIVMPYVSGQSLQHRIDETGVLELKEILRIGKQAAAGLEAVHAEGLVHRDIKPANILLESDADRVKITDFGLARAVDDVRITKPGVVTGTPEYMSPEQARSESVDHRSDLFSLGCVLYAICTGKSPFRAESTVAMIRRVCDDEPQSIQEINPDIPDWLAKLVEKLLAKDPAERFQSAREVAHLLDQYLAHIQEPAINASPPEFQPLLRKTPKPKPLVRQRTTLAVASVLLLLMVGLGLTEVTGLTAIATTIIRVVRGDGTLVVEVDDPNVQVLIDGEELVISGAGPKEIRVRPGKHEVRAVKEGRSVDKRLVTISRGGKEVVRINIERQDSSADDAQRRGIVIREVWAPALDTQGMPSHDGQYLSFVDWETGDVAIHELATGNNRRLTNKGSWEQSSEFANRPVISPDGKFVAYGWLDKDSHWEIRVVGTNGGSEPRVLCEEQDLTYARPYGWSPNGERVLALLSRNEETNQLAVVSLKGGPPTVLKTFDRRSPGMAQFSVDGSHVVYDFPVAENSRKHDIFLLSTDGRREISLVQHPANDTSPIWCPDGQRVLFVSDRTGNPGLWVVRVVDGKPEGSPELIKDDIGHLVPMGLDQDGALYYWLHTGIQDAYIADLDRKTGRIVGLPTPVSERLIGAKRQPRWSRDGKYLCVTRFDPGVGDVLIIVNVETGEERDFPVAPSGVLMLRPPRWSPSGDSLIAECLDYKRRRVLYRIDRETGTLTPVVESARGETVGNPFWSQDGKSVFYRVTESEVEGRRGLHRVQLETGDSALVIKASEGETPYYRLSPDGASILFWRTSADGKARGLVQFGIESGREKVIYRTTDATSQFALSPDGNLLAICVTSGESNSLRVIPFSRDKPRDPVQLDAPASFIHWTADRKHLLFLVQHELWRVAVEAGEANRVGVTLTERGAMGNLSIQPAGDGIAFVAGETKPAVWIMENFMPPVAEVVQQRPAK